MISPYLDRPIRQRHECQEKIILHEDPQRFNYVDQHGANWVVFEVDYFAEQLPGQCCICDAEIENGWLCLDGGEEVCHSHVTL